jgi:hypothetical protein
VNLAVIKKPRHFCREISMPDETARVGVALDAGFSTSLIVRWTGLVNPC